MQVNIDRLLELFHNLPDADRARIVAYFIGTCKATTKCTGLEKNVEHARWALAQFQDAISHNYLFPAGESDDKFPWYCPKCATRIKDPDLLGNPGMCPNCNTILLHSPAVDAYNPSV